MISISQQIRNYLLNVNGRLLLFLILFMNVKLVVKLVVLVIFFLLSFDKASIKKFLDQKFAWFYLSLILISIINLILQFTNWSLDLFVLTAAGISGWVMCLGAAFILFQYINKLSTSTIHQTITLFFLVNAFFTLGQLLLIMIDSGSLNPYTYQGMNQKYFISTGDLLRGLSFDVSTTNAILNAFAVIYFLDRRKMSSLIICMGCLLLTASNFTIVALMAILFYLFIFQSDRVQKSMILVSACMLIIFLARVSPQNKHYIKYVYQKLSQSRIDTIPPDIRKPPLSSQHDSVLNEEDKRKKYAMLFLDSMYTSRMVKKENESIFVNPSHQKPTIPKANIHSDPYQRLKDTTPLQRELLEFAVQNIPDFDTSLPETQKNKLPGKLLAFKQTGDFLLSHPFKIISGNGIGQFSSKLAFRATGMQLSGGYPERFTFINEDFRNNHLNLYLEYFSKDMEIHSLLNTPDSVYDQLLGEYGVAGLLVFGAFYLGYFLLGTRKRNYSLPLFILLLITFLSGYWFEQLSIVIIFEVMMLLNMKETNENSLSS